MAESKSVSKSSPKAIVDFDDFLETASRLPGVYIDREKFLRGALAEHCTPEQIERAVEASPANAGIPKHVLTAVARSSVNHETNQVALVSAAAGLPGGLFMWGTVPADLAQYFAHMLRVSQKLAYIHSWPALFGSETDQANDSTKDVMILFLGVMSGVRYANVGIVKLSTVVAENLVKTLPQKALTQGAIYPIVKKVAAVMGTKMTERVFASGVGKIVPVVGALISGGITYVSFKPMANRLNLHLAKTELAKPKK